MVTTSMPPIGMPPTTTIEENVELEALSKNPVLEPKEERRIRLLKQFAIVFVALLNHFSCGSSYSWPSPALSSMALDNSTLVGTEIALTNTQMDMTGSMIAAGFLLGPWIYGHLVERCGRVWGMRGLVMPLLFGWLMLALSPNPPVLIIARFIIGLGSGLASGVGTMYVAEVSDIEVRGMMLSFSGTAIVTGVLYTLLLGYFLPWHYLSLVCALPPLALLIGTFLLPPSPSYLLVRGEKDKATRVLRRLRGPYADVASEVSKLEVMNLESSSTWRGLLEPMIVKRLLVVMFLFLLQNFCGSYLLIFQTTRVLRSAGVSLNPDLAAVCVGVLQVIGTLASAYIVDKAGRRSCLLISHATSAASLIILGTFVFLAEKATEEDTTYARLSWVPLVCVFVAVTALSIGAHPIPYTCTVEYFPTNIRAKTTAVCLSSCTISMFLVLQLYSVMQEALTQAGLYWFYASVSCLAVIFTLVFVNETKGRNVG